MPRGAPGVHPGGESRDLLLGQRHVVLDRLDAHVTLQEPRRHDAHAVAQPGAVLDAPRPGTHLLVGHQRHRRHRVRPMAALAVLLQDRRDVLREGHRLLSRRPDGSPEAQRAEARTGARRRAVGSGYRSWVGLTSAANPELPAAHRNRRSVSEEHEDALAVIGPDDGTVRPHSPHRPRVPVMAHAVAAGERGSVAEGNDRSVLALTLSPARSPASAPPGARRRGCWAWRSCPRGRRTRRGGSSVACIGTCAVQGAVHVAGSLMVNS